MKTIAFQFWIYSSTISLLFIGSSESLASELRTYQLDISERRPYIRFGEADTIAAKLSGQFDLRLDHITNTARIERLDVRLIEAVRVRSGRHGLEDEGQSLLHSHSWPHNLTQFEGKITSPNTIEFIGPGPARFATNSEGWPMLDYNLDDFIEYLPNGATRLRWGYQTGLQFQLFSRTLRIDGLAAPLDGADNSQPYIVGAFAILIPEPQSVGLILVGLSILLISERRRFPP